MTVPKLSKKKLILVSIATFSVGLIIGSLFFKRISGHALHVGARNIRQQDTAYKFISPLLGSEYDSDQEGTELYPYEKEIKEALQQKITTDKGSEVSVYFSDMANPSWVGINEEAKYNPASLIKLPVMIGYYKLAETDPDLFGRTIKVESNTNNLRNLAGNEPQVTSGNTYSVADLIKYMIVDSDNDALDALYTFRKDALQDVFSDLGFNLPNSDKEIATNNFITPHQVGLFLSVLYDSSYLNRPDSEAALQLLSQTTFKDGLAAGVPSDVVIAHKYGERKFTQAGSPDSYQLHDCGIVYKPKHPYILCVMVKGGDGFDSLEQTIKEISQLVYDKVPQN